MKGYLLSGCLWLFILLHATANGQQGPAFGMATVNIHGQTLAVDYAYTFEQRNRGLMYRKVLCKQCGMLFKFDTPKYASMWMKNTFIPLDVAFIKADGTISDIKAMMPHDLTPVGASSQVLYALEMNQGWFSKNKVKEGDKVSFAFPD